MTWSKEGVNSPVHCAAKCSNWLPADVKEQLSVLKFKEKYVMVSVPEGGGGVLFCLGFLPSLRTLLFFGNSIILIQYIYRVSGKQCQNQGDSKIHLQQNVP